MTQPAFRILSGLAHHQVLPRGADGSAAARLVGESAHAGAVEARVLEGTLVRLDWRRLAVIPAGGASRWEGELAGVPTGGEYRVELRVVEPGGAVLGGCEVRGVAVGDLWLLGGQSNMQGVGNLDDGVEKSSRLVKSFAMSERWETAREPLHWPIDSPDSCHWACKPEERAALAKEARKTRVKGAGLGLTFAKELVKRTGVPVGLIPCAHGGTSMDQWSPALKAQGGAALYGSLLRRTAVAGADGGRAKGLLWYQGESDAGSVASAALFPAKLHGLVAALRADLQAPELPFYQVQIARYPIGKPDPDGWNRVREAQRVAPQAITHCVTVSAIDLPLDDMIHIGTVGLRRLGRRLADVACRELFGMTELETGPRLKSVHWAGPARSAIRVEYEGVNAGFPAGRVGGFSIRAGDGSELIHIYDAAVWEKDPCAVLLRLEGAIPSGAALYYGYGIESYCTLADARDHAAPAFGPVGLDGLEG